MPRHASCDYARSTSDHRDHRAAASRRAHPLRARGDRGRALPEPAAPDRAQRHLRADPHDHVRDAAGARRRALDARRDDSRLPARRARGDRTHPAEAEVRDRHNVRGLLALPAVGGLGALLAWGFSGLPPFGSFHGFYGQLLNAIVLPQRHATNVVTAIVFDYRGFDTMGEEFILFASVVGVVILLRGDNEQPTMLQRTDRVHS